MTSIAYALHVGVKRHAAGVNGLMTTWYHRIKTTMHQTTTRETLPLRFGWPDTGSTGSVPATTRESFDASFCVEVVIKWGLSTFADEAFRGSA